MFGIIIIWVLQASAQEFSSDTVPWFYRRKVVLEELKIVHSLYIFTRTNLVGIVSFGHECLGINSTIITTLLEHSEDFFTSLLSLSAQSSFYIHVHDLKTYPIVEEILIMVVSKVQFECLWHRAKLEMPSCHCTALTQPKVSECFRRNPRFLQWRMNICTHFCIISI